MPWARVESETIKNCFAKIGIKTEGDTGITEGSSEHNEDEDYEHIPEGVVEIFDKVINMNCNKPTCIDNTEITIEFIAKE